MPKPRRRPADPSAVATLPSPPAPNLRLVAFAPDHPGGAPVMAYRRAAAAVLSRLHPSRALAAETYASAAEAVAAGGVRGGSDAGRLPSEGGVDLGPQFHAVGQVTFFRRLESAIGRAPVALAPGVAPSALDLVRLVAIDALSLPRILARLGLARSVRREAILVAAIDDALGRAAVAAGLEGGGAIPPARVRRPKK